VGGGKTGRRAASPNAPPSNLAGVRGGLGGGGGGGGGGACTTRTLGATPSHRLVRYWKFGIGPAGAADSKAAVVCPPLSARRPPPPRLRTLPPPTTPPCLPALQRPLRPYPLLCARGGKPGKKFNAALPHGPP